jgi:hypothetical protein
MGTRYNVKSQYVKNVTLSLQLPSDVTCSQCIVQWKYHTGRITSYCFQLISIVVLFDTGNRWVMILNLDVRVECVVLRKSSMAVLILQSTNPIFGNNTLFSDTDHKETTSNDNS